MVSLDSKFNLSNDSRPHLRSGQFHSTHFAMDRLRHRDRLMSMKYSTIEACFSVPMLNLTLPNFPFVVAFAVKALGWHAASVGWMASLPHICNCLQPLFIAGLAPYFSSFELLVLTFALGALPWGLAGALPKMGQF